MDYENVERGICRIHHRYNAYVTINGVKYKDSFESLERAREWREGIIEKHKSKSRGGRTGVGLKKKKSAKDKDLPVGVTAHSATHTTVDGKKRIYRRVTAFVSADGVLLKAFTRNYRPGLRTKAEAVELVVKLRDEFEKEYFGKGNI